MSMWRTLIEKGGGITAVVAAAISMSVLFSEAVPNASRMWGKSSDEKLSQAIEERNQALNELQNRFHEYELEISNLKSKLQASPASAISSAKAAMSPSLSVKINKLESRIEKFDEKINAINRTILSSPEKAIEVPMLRRDIEVIQEKHTATTSALEKEIASVFEMIKWILGTFVLGMLGLALPLFTRNK